MQLAFGLLNIGLAFPSLNEATHVCLSGADPELWRSSLLALLSQDEDKKCGCLWTQPTQPWGAQGGRRFGSGTAVNA